MRSGSAYEAFLDHQNANNKIVRIVGPNRALTQCPGPNHKNQDHNPSLSVRQGQGRVLLYCFGKCTAEMIVDAMGWKMQDLFDDPGGVAYRYDEGRVVHRKPNKTFSQSGHTNGEVTTLYRLAKITSAPPAEIIFLVEGEQDVETIETLGLLATSAPMGAANFNRVDATPLYGRKIIAIVDKDQKGEEWAQQVRQKLDGMPDLLEFKQAKVGKDASDHITALGSLEDLEEFAWPRSPLLAGLRTGDWLDQQIFPDLRWVVPGIVPEGFSLLVGAPKIGKSYMALGIGLSAALGGPALGKLELDRPRPVLYLALEDSDRRMQKRIRELIPGDPIPKNFQYLTSIERDKVILTILAWLDTLRPKVEPLIILDTVGKVMPVSFQGETTYQRDYRISGWLQGICQKKPGMALVGLHHDRKASADDFVETISGTHGLAGAADTIMLINRKRGEQEGLLKITGRDVEENEYAITHSLGGWTLNGNDLIEAALTAQAARQTQGLGDRSSEIVEFVIKNPDGVRAADVAKKIKITPKDAATYLRRAHEAGRIAKPSPGLYTPVESVETVVNFTTETTQTTQGHDSLFGESGDD